MKLENASISQWEQKCNSDGGSAVELTIRADVVKDGSYSTFCNPDVRRDFENYISQYKYGDGAKCDRAEEEIESVKKYCRELQQKYTSFRAKLCDIFDQLSYYESEDDIIARVKAVRDVRECTERHNTELIKENEELKEKVKDLELLFGSEQSISKKLSEDVNALCDGHSELRKDLKKAQSERAKLEKDLMDVADILQVGGLRTINDILDKAHYWVHERSIDDEELKMILRMDPDASREDILDKTLEVVKEASECKETHATLINVYNECLGDFLSFRDKIKKMVGCESNECSEILDVLKAHLEDKKELSGKLEMYRRFRDDIMTTFGIKSCDENDILYELYRASLLAEKTEFICEYFDTDEIPLTSLAENLCLEIKEKVISEYKAEVEAKRQDGIRDAAKKCGSVGNGVYLDGLTVEQNLRAENVRLKAENEKYKTHISELEESLDCIHCEAAAALGYECE